MSRPILDDPRLCNSRYIIDPTVLVRKSFFLISARSPLQQHTLHVVTLKTEALRNAKWTFFCALQTRSWHFTHAHTSSGCSPQIGSQTGHLARQLAALFVHAPHAVDKRREHTSRTWTSEPDPNPAANSSVTLRLPCRLIQSISLGLLSKILT